MLLVRQFFNCFVPPYFGYLLIIFLLSLVSCSQSSELKRVYGATDEAVLLIANLYEVDAEKIDSFGPQPFPANLILSRLGWHFDQEKPTVYRSLVTNTIKGYVAKCSLSNTNDIYTYYLGFAQILEDGPGPLIIIVSYEIDHVNLEPQHDSQVVENISLYNSRDSGGLNWPLVVGECSR